MKTTLLYLTFMLCLTFGPGCKKCLTCTGGPSPEQICKGDPLYEAAKGGHSYVMKTDSFGHARFLVCH